MYPVQSVQSVEFRTKKVAVGLRHRIVAFILCRLEHRIAFPLQPYMRGTSDVEVSNIFSSTSTDGICIWGIKDTDHPSLQRPVRLTFGERHSTFTNTMN